MKRVISFFFTKLAERLAKTWFAELYVVKWAGNIVARFAMAKVVEHDGHTIYLDKHDSLRLSVRKYFEPLETEVVSKLLAPGDIVVDVGANIGYYTLIFARLVGPEGRVFAFEPDPDNFAILKKNIEANGYENVVLAQQALTDSPCQLTLYREATHSASHSIWKAPHSVSSVEIEGIMLDTFLESYPEDRSRLKFIKMDIEGAESKALDGMQGVMQANPELTIVTELNPVGLSAMGTDVPSYLAKLESLGFSLSEINEEENYFGPADVSSLIERHPSDRHTFTNLLCERTEADRVD